VFGLAAAGALLLTALHVKGGDFSKLHARQSAWFGIFVAGLAVISYLGNYGNGLKVLPYGSDIALVSLLSLGVFWLALKSKIDAAETRALLAATPPELD
jgi:hypothetical protein